MLLRSKTVAAEERKGSGAAVANCERCRIQQAAKDQRRLASRVGAGALLLLRA